MLPHRKVLSEALSVAARLVVVAFVLVVGTSACSNTVTFETGKFREMTLCDRELKRGVSTKDDVRRLFGPPDGYGSFIFAEGALHREIWFYYDLRAVFGPGYTRDGVGLDQQALMVFFDKEYFDGYLRYANEGLLRIHSGSE